MIQEQKENVISTLKEPTLIPDWTQIIDGSINVPDELDEIVNKVGNQIRMVTISGKNEAKAVCDIVYGCQKFFKKMYGIS